MGRRRLEAIAVAVAWLGLVADGAVVARAWIGRAVEWPLRRLIARCAARLALAAEQDVALAETEPARRLYDATECIDAGYASRLYAPAQRERPTPRTKPLALDSFGDASLSLDAPHVSIPEFAPPFEGDPAETNAVPAVHITASPNPSTTSTPTRPQIPPPGTPPWILEGIRPFAVGLGLELAPEKPHVAGLTLAFVKALRSIEREETDWKHAVADEIATAALLMPQLVDEALVGMLPTLPHLPPLGTDEGGDPSAGGDNRRGVA